MTGSGAIVNRRWQHLSRHLSNPASIWEAATASGEQVQRPCGRNGPGTFKSSKKASVLEAEGLRPRTALKVSTGTNQISGH